MQTHPDSILAVLGPVITVLAAMLVGALAGVVSEVLVFKQLRQRSRENWVMNSFLLTVGLSVVLINAHQLFFGADFKGLLEGDEGCTKFFMNKCFKENCPFSHKVKSNPTRAVTEGMVGRFKEKLDAYVAKEAAKN